MFFALRRPQKTPASARQPRMQHTTFRCAEQRARALTAQSSTHRRSLHGATSGSQRSTKHVACGYAQAATSHRLTSCGRHAGPAAAGRQRGGKLTCGTTNRLEFRHRHSSGSRGSFGFRVQITPSTVEIHATTRSPLPAEINSSPAQTERERLVGLPTRSQQPQHHTRRLTLHSLALLRSFVGWVCRSTGKLA